MFASASHVVNNSQGKSTFWSNSRFTHKVEEPDSQPATTLPPPVDVGALDGVRKVFWQAYRHLFPPHVLAAQTGSGGIVISWSVADDPHAIHPYAAPIVLRFDSGLVERMRQADGRERIRLALAEEPTLREGLRGYDPFARFPKLRVINVG